MSKYFASLLVNMSDEKKWTCKEHLQANKLNKMLYNAKIDITQKFWADVRKQAFLMKSY